MPNEDRSAHEREQIRMELQELASRCDHVRTWLRSELGYESDSPGNINRHIGENYKMIQETLETLRGKGNDLGLVGRVDVIWRSWILLVYALGTLCGYLLKDVIG